MSSSYRDFKKAPLKPQANNAQKPEEGAVQIDGFNQVLEMLRIADPAFRESILRRLAQRDAALANELRRDLNLT